MAWIAPIAAAVGETAGTVGSGLASAAGTVGSALGSAGSAIGSGLGSLGGEIGSLVGGAPEAVSGLTSVGEGLQSLFGGGEAGNLAALGQAVPEGVELLGPSSTFAGPGFMSGLLQGYTGTLGQVASPSAGTQIGGGVGQLLSALQEMHASRGAPGSGAALPQLMHLVAPPQTGPATRLLPASALASPSGRPEQGPIMKMIGQLFAGF